MSHKPKAILFGASIGGQKALKALKRDYDVIAFSDNDTKKHGTLISNKHIISPKELVSINYDKVIITSQYAMEIYAQLTDDLNIERSKIIVANDLILNGGEDTPWLGYSAIALVLGLLGLSAWKLLS